MAFFMMLRMHLLLRNNLLFSVICKTLKKSGITAKILNVFYIFVDILLLYPIKNHNKVKIENINERLCETLLITEFDSFEDVLNIYKKFKDNNVEKSVVITLDDLGQAEYTSGHSIHYNDLDDVEGYDLSTLEKSCFEDGGHCGCLTTPSEFFIRKGNFEKKIKENSFAKINDLGLSILDEDIEILKKINSKPDSFIDNEVILQIVPVSNPYETIMAFPNGYFEGDLNPFQNYNLAKYLYEKYDCILFGIGASLLGFLKNRELSTEECKQLNLDIINLYNSDKNEILLEQITNSEYFFLMYTESIEHYGE